MGDKLFKYVQWILYLLMGLSALFVILFYISPANPNIILYWMYTMIILSIVIILSVSVYGMMKNPKGSYKVLLAVAGIVVLFLLTYLFSKNTYSPALLEKYNISANGVKWVGAGLMTAYIFVIVSVGTLVYSSISKFFK